MCHKGHISETFREENHIPPIKRQNTSKKGSPLSSSQILVEKSVNCAKLLQQKCINQENQEFVTIGHMCKYK